MFDSVLAFLADETNQQVLHFLGGGLTALGGAAWTCFKYVWPKRTGEASSGNEVLADRGSTAVGGNLSIDNSSTVNTGLDGRSVLAIVAVVAGAGLLAASFAGTVVTAKCGSVAVGGDISGSTVIVSDTPAGNC